jgi:hypothetical protein
LKNPADDSAIGEHIVILIVALAGRAERGRALEDKTVFVHRRSSVLATALAFASRATRGLVREAGDPIRTSRSDGTPTWPVAPVTRIIVPLHVPA